MSPVSEYRMAGLPQENKDCFCFLCTEYLTPAREISQKPIKPKDLFNCWTCEGNKDVNVYLETGFRPP